MGQNLCSHCKHTTKQTDTFDIKHHQRRIRNKSNEKNSLQHESACSYSTSSIDPEMKEKIQEAFQYAVQTGNDSLAMYFVGEYPFFDLLNVRFEHGNNALHVAVNNSSYNLVLYLLTNGVSPNSPNSSNGDSALHLAVRAGDSKIVALLSKYGADGKITNNKYESPVSIATDNRNQDILNILIPSIQQTEGDITKLNNTDSMEGIVNDINFVLDQTKTHHDMDNKSNKENEKKFPLNVIRISRTNPFNKLKRQNTGKLEEIISTKEALPVLQGWMEKKKPTKKYRKYQKRWFIVRGSFFLWSDIQRDIKDPKDMQQRIRFNNCVNLRFIKEVNVVSNTKNQRKFVMMIQDKGKSKEYLFRCTTTKDRNYWVEGLTKHIKYHKSVVSYLGTTTNRVIE